ncbi:MAG: ABC transporter ATP-binding protein [Myxococcota bacterium]
MTAVQSFFNDVAVVRRWSAQIWRDHPRMLAGIVLGSFPTAILLVAFPWLWQYVIDALDAGAQPVRLRELAIWMLLAGLGHALAYTLLQGARGFGNAVVSGHARNTVIDAVAKADPDALRRWRTGELVSRLHDDAGDKISWFLCSGVFRAWESFLVVLCCFTLMVTTEPGLAIWVVGPLPFLLLAQAGFQSALARRHQRVQRAIAQVSDQLTTTFSSIRVVQACGLSDLARRRFVASTREQRDAEVRVAILQQGIERLYQYGWQVAMVALLWFGGLRVLEGDLTLGRYLTFEGLLAVMVWPMFDLGTLASKLPQAAVALRRLDEVVALPIAAPSVNRKDGAGALASGLRLVSPKGAPLIEDVDLDVIPGRRVGLVGTVGAGKTLVMEALSGLRAPAHGTVAVADAAVVPQVPVLLSATVRENILLGREVSDAVLDRALRIAQVDRDLPQLAQGLDTWVGERGSSLSGGQRQRVAIARALVGQPQVLLLDDATSALDAEVEAAFWDALETEAPHVGALLVSHRVGTLSKADEIVVLEGGRVVQRGSHQALIEVDGPYRTLYGA